MNVSIKAEDANPMTSEITVNGEAIDICSITIDLDPELPITARMEVYLKTLDLKDIEGVMFTTIGDTKYKLVEVEDKA